MAGIYIHIPFCRKKCAYCDFHFSTTFDSYRDRMLDAMLSEVHERQAELSGQEVRTIYFGGGTPSLLLPQELQKLLDAIQNIFSVAADAEITLEANPEDVHVTTLLDWKKLGINRLSIGLQSFRQQDLDWMNRAHSMEESRQSVRLAQAAGFSNMTVDLMYGLPNLRLFEWRAHVQEVIQMGVPHISAYCLTIEHKTALENMIESGALQAASEEEQAEQFLVLVSELHAAGLEQYEISNFAVPGIESKHNSAYWQGEYYLGIGPSAHSFDGRKRRWNIANNARYMRSIEKGEVFFEEEILTEEDRFNERLLTGLRTREGVAMDALNTNFSARPQFIKCLKDFEDKGWLHISNAHLVLSDEGKLRADFIAAELFAEGKK